MTEDEAQFRQAPPRGRRLVVYLLFGLLEEPDGLLAFVHQVLNEEAKVLVVVQKGNIFLVALEYHAQLLVRVREDVQDEGRAVLQVQPPVGALVHHLVHRLPRLLDGFLVDSRLGPLGLVDSVRDGLEPVPRPGRHIATSLRLCP